MLVAIETPQAQGVDGSAIGPLIDACSDWNTVVAMATSWGFVL